METDKGDIKEPTKVVFGALTAPTPLLATWIFRAVFIITSAVTIWIAGTELISTSAKVETMLILKMVDALVLGFSKMFGVVPDGAEQPAS
jgi:hypothetical protein